MPPYEVEYSCALKKEQKDALANAIANVHHQHFGTLLYFVRTKFTDGSVNDNYEGAYAVSDRTRQPLFLSTDGTRPQPTVFLPPSVQEDVVLIRILKPCVLILQVLGDDYGSKGGIEWRLGLAVDGGFNRGKIPSSVGV